MNDKPAHNIQIKVEVVYIEGQSDPDNHRHVFAYTITIRNEGSIAVRLISRYWKITNSDAKIHEVRGDGVVGEQPHLKPGSQFQYTSGTMIETPVGSMEGYYQMIDDDGVKFEAKIPVFSLSLPRSLH